MTTAQQCPSCGAVLAPDAPGGDCPRCLLKLGLRAALFGEVKDTEATGGDVAPEIELEGYRIIGKLGEGGCGIVYKALQLEPFRREVAVKVIKLGMDTRSVIARFELERQALALMDHPGIAKVFDAGSTKAGRPYFAMELVQGKAITTWCDEQGFGIAQRLELFAEVCQAVQHAHQKGIIHRDLKPTNVLVSSADGRARAKVIDFGVARATARQRLADQTIYTAFDQFVGTPAYMSPEQAGATGEDIDTRSDIYSLGVLLYELLTGRPPFDPARLQSAALDEICRIIREEEPPRPSTRFAVVAGRVAEAGDRGSNPETREPMASRLRDAGGFKSDLDWVVMKALEKDRERRYPSAAAFASDVQCVLGDQPVLARPPSALYRFRKMARRNRVAVTAAATVSVALLAAAVISTWRFSLEKQARERAVLAEEKARLQAKRNDQVARLLKDTLSSAAPSVARGRDTTLLREILDRSAARISEELGDQPATKAELYQTLGQVYGNAGELNKAVTLQREALALREQIYGPEHEWVAESLADLARALTMRAQSGDFAEGESLARRALALRRKLHPHDDDRVVSALELVAWNLRAQKSGLAEAETLVREALAIREKLHGSRSLEASHGMYLLALIYQQNPARRAEAEQLLKNMLAIQRKSLSEGDPSTADAVHTLALILWSQGRSAEAEPVTREAAEQARKLFGSDSQRLVGFLSLESCILSDLGKYEESERVVREAVALAVKHMGREHPKLAEDYWPTLTWALYGQRKFTEAEATARDSVALARKLDRPEVLRHSLFWLTLVLTAQDRWAEAEPFLREQLALCERLHPGPGSWAAGRCAQAQTMLGQALFRRGESVEAESMFLTAYEALKGRTEGWAVVQRERCLTQLAEICHATGRPAEATEWKAKLDEFKQAHPGN